MGAFTNLDIHQAYENYDNFYDFTWNDVQGASWYDLYGNNVLFLHTQPQHLPLRQSVINIINTIARATGHPIKSGDTVTYYLVARSYTNQIIGVSNFVRMPVIFYIAAQPPKAFPKDNGIRISGALIDCSSLKGSVQISLYSLNGAKVWAK